MAMDYVTPVPSCAQPTWTDYCYSTHYVHIYYYSWDYLVVRLRLHGPHLLHSTHYLCPHYYRTDYLALTTVA